MKSESADTVIAAAAQKTGLAGGGVALYGGLAANEIAAFGGLILAALGVAVQWYYRRRDDHRAQEMHQAKLIALRSDENGDGDSDE